MTEFDRANPLFERARVPCDLIIHHPGNNNNVVSSHPSKKVVHYTLRILEGRRPIPGGTERAVRIELSDECNRFRSNAHHSSGSVTSCGSHRKKNAIKHGHQHEPSYQHHQNLTPSSSVGQQPPVMMMQNRPPPPIMQDSSGRGASQLLDQHTVAVMTGPIQLYELEVGETDFSELRRDQALLVDFSDFARSFVSLLTFCDLGEEETDSNNISAEPNISLSENTYNSGMNEVQGSQGVHSMSNQSMGSQWIGQTQHSSCFNSPGFDGAFTSPYRSTPIVSRYVCRLEDFSHPNSGGTCNNSSSGGGNWNNNTAKSGKSPQARFSVVESNQFRELTHLSLNLTKGTDATVRTYLSQRLGQTMSWNATLKSQLKQELERAEVAERTATDATERCNQIMLSTETEKRELQLEAKEQMHQEHTKSAEELKRALNEKETEIEKLKETYCKNKEGSATKIEELERRQDLLLKGKSAAENENDKLNNTMSLRDETIKALTADISSLRTQLQSVTDEKNMMEKSLHQTQLQVVSLEQSNESQEKVMTQSDLLRKTAEQGSSEARKNLEDQRTQMEELRQRLLEVEAETTKQRDIIAKYQRDRQEMKRRIKSKVDIIKQQEEVLTQKENEATELMRQIQETTVEKNRTQNENIAREKELNDVRGKLEESAKLLESNQQVITWLNKEINDAQLGRGRNASTFGIGGSASRVGVTPHDHSNVPTSSSAFYPSYITPPDLKGSNTPSLPQYSRTSPITVVHPFPTPVPNRSELKATSASHFKSIPHPLPTHAPNSSEINSASAQTHHGYK
uniref:Spindle assembly abnormal protein 6 N-terminal domain-containing protein n=1 Tax=Ditylum brightwellii TaxID=49249 RepID=A0A7S4V816_9STRA